MEDIFKKLGSYFEPKDYPVHDLQPEKLPIEVYKLLGQLEVCINISRYFTSIKSDYENNDALNRCIIHVKTRIAELKNELSEYEFIDN